jgi:hypothetical protein
MAPGPLSILRDAIPGGMAPQDQARLKSQDGFSELDAGAAQFSADPV